MKTDIPIRIALVDDQKIYLNGTAMLLDAQDNFKVVIRAIHGKDFIEQLMGNNPPPDICLLDIQMPVMNGFETITKVKQNWPDIKIVILTLHDHEHTIIHMLKEGACGYLLKNCPPEELYACINAVYKKGFYYNGLSNGFTLKFDLLPKLTEKEIMFLSYCCEQLTYKEIIELMGISERRAENYRESLFLKLNIKNRVGLAMFATQTGLIKIAPHK